MMFHLMFAHYTFSSVWLLSGYLLGNSCPLDWSCVLIVLDWSCVLILFTSYFGYKSSIRILIANFFLLYSIYKYK